MAVNTNTDLVNVLTSTGELQPTLRESLMNAIHNATPFDTRVLDMTSRSRAMSHKEEWLIDDFNVQGLSPASYGATYDNQARRNPERRQTIIQTNMMGFQVADEENAMRNAGFSNREMYDIAKAMKEFRIMKEKSIIGSNRASQAPSADNNTTGTTASFMAFLSTNTDFAADGADGGWSAASKEHVARTDGTQRAFTEKQLQSTLKKLYEKAGGIEGCELMVNTSQKDAFNGFAGITSQEMANSRNKQAGFVAAANSYLSNFGSLSVVLNRHMRQRDAFIWRPSDCMIKTLWWMRARRRPVDGNFRSWGLSSSWAYCVKDERIHAGIFDLTS